MMILFLLQTEFKKIFPSNSFLLLLDKTNFAFLVLKLCPPRWFSMEEKEEYDLSLSITFFIKRITYSDF